MVNKLETSLATLQFQRAMYVHKLILILHTRDNVYVHKLILILHIRDNGKYNLETSLATLQFPVMEISFIMCRCFLFLCLQIVCKFLFHVTYC
ncbi:hypothetical protein Avbf_07505 [Armadillidium vulgare]|nr:hypothetical protein Avbf_07505 [Armadillidium vulgare]